MPVPDTTPIAIYTERLPQVRREFALHADRIVVNARWLFGRRHVSVIPFSGLTPRTTRLTIRNRLVKRSILIGSLAVAVAVVFARPGYMPWIHLLSPVAWGVAGVSAALAAYSFPKTPFVRFLRTDGRPGLDIGQAGPDTAHFDDFVEQVRRAIRSQK